jgi:shikimate kinase
MRGRHDMNDNRHPVAVLIGFSTTGKSTVSRAFASLANAGTMDIHDTDKMIGAYHGGHIYNAYLSLVRNDVRKEALDDIDKRETDFFNSFAPVKPTLVVAGPNLVLREPAWENFLKKIKHCCFYLTINPLEVYDGLMHRYVEEHATVGTHRAFGSWNDGMTTKYEKSRWVLVDKITAIKNIESNMKEQVSLYERASSNNGGEVVQGGPVLRENHDAQARLVERIRTYLTL